MERFFRRKLYDKLLTWKQEKKGKTALLIEGARRVGKSTIVEEFAKHEYKSYILIDFNKVGKRIKELFDDLNNLDYIFLTLQANYGVNLEPRKSVIIFDEVQKCPLARQAIKYLVADGRYDYIETGSLISIKKNTQNITIPSEEDRITMFPMDYEEFRWALGDTATVPLLRTFYEKRLPLGAAFRTKMREFRLYMLVGGMPQAVNEYLGTNNLQKVDTVKRSIIMLYEDDFLKMHLDRTFQGSPFVLTGNYPYNISSQIFFKMLDNKDLIPCCTGMIQKEVAERITAAPGNKTYGILSVLIQAWYNVEYLFTVHEHVFNPPPKVKSAVIRMTRNNTKELGCDERLFKRLVKTTFNQRRKTLRNNIRPLLGELDAERAKAGLPALDHTAFLQDPLFNKRPEQLSVAEFIELTNKVQEESPLP